MQTIPPLPIGSQDFEGIVKGNYIYVDKTKYLYALLQPGIQKGASGPKYFFSRPRRFGKSLTLSTLDAIFSGKKEIIILIDEYDKPILDHITTLPIAKENRDVLKGFYEIIKANDETIRFLFITGITKFSQTTIFSGLNNLRDISLDPRYAAICGYTQEELESCFAQHMAYFAQVETQNIGDLRRALDNGNIPEMFRILKVFFSKISYDIQEATEKYYQSLFHLIFTVIGTRIRSEVRTNTGRIDAIVETATHRYLFEFKLNGSAQEALDQIDTKDYPFSFQDLGKIIQKMGVCFSMLNRNIDEWRGSPHISNPLSPETPRPLGAIPC